MDRMPRSRCRTSTGWRLALTVALVSCWCWCCSMGAAQDFDPASLVFTIVYPADGAHIDGPHLTMFVGVRAPEHVQTAYQVQICMKMWYDQLQVCYQATVTRDANAVEMDVGDIPHGAHVCEVTLLPAGTPPDTPPLRSLKVRFFNDFGDYETKQLITSRGVRPVPDGNPFQWWTPDILPEGDILVFYGDRRQTAVATAVAQLGKNRTIRVVDAKLDRTGTKRDFGLAETPTYTSPTTAGANIVHHEQVPQIDIAGVLGLASISAMYADMYTMFSALRAPIPFDRLVCSCTAGTIWILDRFWNFKSWEGMSVMLWTRATLEFGIQYEYLGYDGQTVVIRFTNAPSNCAYQVADAVWERKDLENGDDSGVRRPFALIDRAAVTLGCGTFLATGRTAPDRNEGCVHVDEARTAKQYGPALLQLGAFLLSAATKLPAFRRTAFQTIGLESLESGMRSLPFHLGALELAGFARLRAGDANLAAHHFHHLAQGRLQPAHDISGGKPVLVGATAASHPLTPVVCAVKLRHDAAHLSWLTDRGFTSVEDLRAAADFLAMADTGSTTFPNENTRRVYNSLVYKPDFAASPEPVIATNMFPGEAPLELSGMFLNPIHAHQYFQQLTAWYCAKDGSDKYLETSLTEGFASPWLLGASIELLLNLQASRALEPLAIHDMSAYKVLEPGAVVAVQLIESQRCAIWGFGSGVTATIGGKQHVEIEQDSWYLIRGPAEVVLSGSMSNSVVAVTIFAQSI